MSNTSATGGYLVPSSTAPAEDDALDDLFADVVAGVTGLDRDQMVRPRWQRTPPAEPAIDVNWCAVGVMDSDPDANAWIGHDHAGNGSDRMQRHEQIEVLASFYGPNAKGYASLLRDGLAVTQNREALYAAGIAYVEAGRIIAAPDLANQQWRRRFDITLTFRRQVNRTYPVLNLLSAEGEIATDPAASTPWSTE